MGPTMNRPTAETIRSAMAAQRPWIEALFNRLADGSRGEPGIMRDTYGEGEDFAHRVLAEHGRAQHLQVSHDNGGIVWVDGLHQGEPGGMRLAYLDGVAGVVAVRHERRDQQCAIDTDRVHRRHHVVAGDLLRAGLNRGPGPARMIAFVGVHLGVDCWHSYSLLPGRCRSASSGYRRRSRHPVAAPPDGTERQSRSAPD
jgi:hypothetical protein